MDRAEMHNKFGFLESDRHLSQEEQQIPALTFKEVSFSYHGQLSNIRSVSFTVPQGQWVTIVGSNGSGKSTLARLFNGLLMPDEGLIVTAGMELKPDHLPAIRRKVGMVFQNPDNQFVGSTVEEDIAFGLEGMCLPAQEIRKKVDLYAEQFGVSHLLKRHPSELSGGQKQRVALASVLAMEPEILVLDEASSMLDEQARRDLTETLQKMHCEGRYTILSITHDADEIMASERVLALREGAIIGDLSPDELFRDEELLSRCSLEAPFARKLVQELETRGLTKGQIRDEQELMDFLWSFN